MKKLTATFAVWVMAMACTAFGAERAPFQFEVEYNYGAGISISDKDFNGSFGSSTVMLEALYNINSRFTTGLGVGVSAGSIATTIPVNAILRYRPFSSPRIKDFYAFTNLGVQPTSVDSNDNNKIKAGFIADAGIGWQKMFRRHFGIDLKLGYSYRRSEATSVELVIDESTGSILAYNNRRFGVDCHYLSLGIGLVF